MNSKLANINKNTQSDHQGLSYISDIVADIKATAMMVVLMDDKDREAS